jgi:RND family efflux transporter MFP subunit
MSSKTLRWILAVSALVVSGWFVTLWARGTANLMSNAAAVAKTTEDAKAPVKRKVLYWWDPMLGPSSISDHPGKSAMGMDMVPVYEGQSTGGPEITIDPRVTQAMGVQTAVAGRGPLHKTICAVGIFDLPQPGLHDVSLKVSGWIDKLFADQEGAGVVKDQPLFAVYSPDLQVASQELISAVKSARALPAGASQTLRNEAQRLVDSARRKLELWDVADADIDAIAASDQPPRDIIFRSPATGHLEEKMVVQGSSFQAGMKLMRISDHNVVWLDAQVYEQQIPWVKIGQPVDATTDAVPGKTFKGKVTFVYPHLDHMARTLTVRATFDNPNFELRPGMYGEANLITEPAADAVLVPQEAVIDTGTQQIVFIAEGSGHFTPRNVRAGLRGDNDQVQILEGLSPGETVVTSGQFLMDVESRTQEAIAKLRGGSSAAPVAEAPSIPATSESPPPVIQGNASKPPPQPSPGVPREGDSAAPATQAQRLSLVYCPMAKVHWVQSPGKVDNPYLGPEMQTCGEVQADLASPARDAPLAGVVESYLKVQHALASGQLGPAAVHQLKAAADKVDGPTSAQLRTATEKLATAADAKAAHEQFKDVSKALIPLLQKP